MPTHPLTGARLGQDATDAPLGGTFITEAVNELSPFTVPRFDNVAARDAAYQQWVQAGNTIRNGMICWTDSPASFWRRVDGTWKRDPGTRPYAHFRQSASQPVGLGGPAALSWQEILADTASFRSTQYLSRLYAANAGIYMLRGEVHLAGPNVDSRLWLQFVLNGAKFPDSVGPITFARSGFAVSATFGPRPVSMAAGDWVELQAVADDPKGLGLVDRSTAVNADWRSSVVIWAYDLS